MGRKKIERTESSPRRLIWIKATDEAKEVRRRFKGACFLQGLEPDEQIVCLMKNYADQFAKLDNKAQRQSV